ncbi:hypothetical protein ACFFSY_07725 [Paenibacillus aurantiacus]|uniref:Uncharacterized protein n=1 Tax=Paenibacillus aurantiacus TaxID=1936118 RepID=A0ABV5KKR1_9BACL
MSDVIQGYDFRIVSADGESTISFMLEQYVPGESPSISCAIEIKDHRFTGRGSNVWFTLHNFDTFAHQLRGKNVAPRIELASTFPEDFEMSVETLRFRKDQLAIRYFLSTGKYGANADRYEVRLSGGFEIDQACYLAMIEQFGRLAALPSLDTGNMQHP